MINSTPMSYPDVLEIEAVKLEAARIRLEIKKAHLHAQNLKSISRQVELEIERTRYHTLKTRLEVENVRTATIGRRPRRARRRSKDKDRSNIELSKNPNLTAGKPTTKFGEVQATLTIRSCRDAANIEPKVSMEAHSSGHVPSQGVS